MQHQLRLEVEHLTLDVVDVRGDVAALDDRADDAEVDLTAQERQRQRTVELDVLAGDAERVAHVDRQVEVVDRDAGRDADRTDADLERVGGLGVEQLEVRTHRDAGRHVTERRVQRAFAVVLEVEHRDRQVGHAEVELGARVRAALVVAEAEAGLDVLLDAARRRAVDVADVTVERELGVADLGLRPEPEAGGQRRDEREQHEREEDLAHGIRRSRSPRRCRG
ncbi:MAG: hypothetical protein ACE37K_17845 [Planctomycetota bacterium]